MNTNIRELLEKIYTIASYLEEENAPEESEVRMCIAKVIWMIGLIKMKFSKYDVIDPIEKDCFSKILAECLTQMETLSERVPVQEKGAQIDEEFLVVFFRTTYLVTVALSDLVAFHRRALMQRNLDKSYSNLMRFQEYGLDYELEQNYLSRHLRLNLHYAFNTEENESLQTFFECLQECAFDLDTKRYYDRKEKRSGVEMPPPCRCNFKHFNYPWIDLPPTLKDWIQFLQKGGRPENFSSLESPIGEGLEDSGYFDPQEKDKDLLDVKTEEYSVEATVQIPQVLGTEVSDCLDSSKVKNLQDLGAGDSGVEAPVQVPQVSGTDVSAFLDSLDKSLQDLRVRKSSFEAMIKVLEDLRTDIAACLASREDRNLQDLGAGDSSVEATVQVTQDLRTDVSGCLDSLEEDKNLQDLSSSGEALIKFLEDLRTDIAACLASCKDRNIQDLGDENSSVKATVQVPQDLGTELSGCIDSLEDRNLQDLGAEDSGVEATVQVSQDLMTEVFGCLDSLEDRNLQDLRAENSKVEGTVQIPQDLGTEVSGCLDSLEDRNLQDLGAEDSGVEATVQVLQDLGTEVSGCLDSLEDKNLQDLGAEDSGVEATVQIPQDLGTAVSGCLDSLEDKNLQNLGAEDSGVEATVQVSQDLRTEVFSCLASPEVRNVQNLGAENSRVEAMVQVPQDLGTEVSGCLDSLEDRNLQDLGAENSKVEATVQVPQDLGTEVFSWLDSSEVKNVQDLRAEDSSVEDKFEAEDLQDLRAAEPRGSSLVEDQENLLALLAEINEETTYETSSISTFSPNPTFRFSLNDKLLGKTFGERRMCLMRWCKQKLKSYYLPMYDFSCCWTSGRALVSIMHYYRADLIEARYLSEESPWDTLVYGEKMARYLGVLSTTDFVEECLKEQPSQFVVIPYVQKLRRCLESPGVPKPN